ncbi:uncharacterized protein LOC111994700 [Quercus suber]|uniref:uncharacterized protein LOC111994700 n=1 Tax=Quercus suber TaxID=58331 RepID=UPI000CE20A46|nr:myosin-2 heavy chain-like [Quercus suber]
MLGSEPLKEDASLRDFNGGIGCHVASVLEESLLLPKDMTELRGLRKNEVFLNAKRYLGMAVQATFRLDCQQLDDDRKRQLKKKLAEEDHARKSADSALENTQRQVEDQRKRLREANNQLITSKEQITTLKKQLKDAQRLKDQAEKAKAEVEKAKAEAEKERDKAEQHGYDVSVAETEDNLRAEVPTLRRPKNVYFPPAIRVSNPHSNQKEAATTVADSAKEAQTQNPLPLNQQEQPKILEVTKDTSSNKVAEASKEEAVSQSFEQALASTILPAGEVPKEKEMEIPPEAIDKAPKSKLQIKLKP